ncbi:hypothetical protein V8C86DRAFT_2916757 [Haematococcus lacustris]
MQQISGACLAHYKLFDRFYTLTSLSLHRAIPWSMSSPLTLTLLLAILCSTLALPTAPSVSLLKLGSCDLATQSNASCTLTPFNVSGETFTPGQMSYIDYKNAAASPQGIFWNGYNYTLRMLNNQVAPQAFLWAFGIATTAEAAAACLLARYNLQQCNPSQTWSVIGPTRAWPITNTQHQEGMAVVIQGAGQLASPANLGLTNISAGSFVVFMGSLSSLPITATLALFNVTPTFGNLPAQPGAAELTAPAFTLCTLLGVAALWLMAQARG